ncbi:thiolase family protein [Kerstersia sp.]|uniref:thiolase family protein n=1 Tax=Kerstersia sp. TaxID=1930783 RepID=UPI003F917F30
MTAAAAAQPGAGAGGRARGYEGVAVVMPVTIPYQRFSAQTAHWWLGQALRQLVQGAGLDKNEVDGLCVSSFTLGSDTAVGLVQHFGLSPRFLEHIPMGGASGVVALRRAARAVQAGDADIVACIAGDSNQAGSFQETISQFSRFSQDAVLPYGAGGPNASFALLTDYYMRRYGATRADFGKLCVAQRDNALRNPHALMKKPLSLQQYLDARPIAEPIHLFDCVMPCAGAEGYLVMSADRARQLGLPAVRVLATQERHNAFPQDDIQYRGGWAMDCDAFYAQAGLGPEDADFFEAYDDYPVINFLQLEDLGFCAKGEAAAFVRQHDFTLTGSLPFNTSGGQLSAGQAGAAGGYLGLVQALRQLTGQAGPMQVAGAQVGLVSGFGMINYDRGLCTAAAMLQKEAS